MADTSAPDPQADRALAQVFVTDFDRSLAFYRDVLGFDVVFTYGDPAFYGEVSRGDAAFNLRHVDDSPFVAGVRDAGQLLSVSMRITDAALLFVEYEAAGVEFQERLRDKPWRDSEFVVRDPDGNLILFGSPTEQR
ncbi:MAG TPA: VOC family protein [Actinomycetota bacterium]